MKKITTLAVLVLLVTFYLPACKKKDKQQTTLEKIQGIWQIDTVIQNDHISSEDNIDTLAGDPGNIADFRTDGKVYLNIQSEADTSTYNLISDTKIVLDQATINEVTYDIITLTANVFILHSKQTASGSSNFFEETITLKNKLRRE